MDGLGGGPGRGQRNHWGMGTYSDLMGPDAPRLTEHAALAESARPLLPESLASPGTRRDDYVEKRDRRGATPSSGDARLRAGATPG